MTTTELIPAGNLEAALSPVMDRAREYARQSKASNTIRAYRSDWRDFEEWCFSHRRQALPATPETVALYLTSLAEQGRKTLDHHPACLGYQPGASDGQPSFSNPKRQGAGRPAGHSSHERHHARE